GIRGFHVTGVQTCALPILELPTFAMQGQPSGSFAGCLPSSDVLAQWRIPGPRTDDTKKAGRLCDRPLLLRACWRLLRGGSGRLEIGRASCRGRVKSWGVGV